MKIGGIFGVFLSMLTFMGAINFSIFQDEAGRNNAFALADSGETISDNAIESETKVFDMENNSDIEILTYTNFNNRQVTINSSNISINCIGSGKNAFEDEELVENNFKINAAFAKDENGEKYSSLIVKAREKAYIYVIGEYIGEEYPENEVKCEYTININAN